MTESRALLQSAQRFKTLRIEIGDRLPAAAARGGNFFMQKQHRDIARAWLLLTILGIAGLAAAFTLGATRLPAQAQGSWAEGVVTNTQGIALAQARVILEDASGKALASTMTDDRGGFRLPLAAAKTGACRIEVERAGYAVARTVIKAASGSNLQVNFVLKVAPSAEPAASLGSVSFYREPKFESGQLKDPSAGGGYSDQASVEENQMIGQYLAPAGPVRSAQPDAGEKGLENTGAAMLARRDYARATPFYRHAVGRYPHSARLQAGLGISLYGQGQFPAAVEALCASARLAPDDPSTFLLLSEAIQLTPQPDATAARLLKNFAATHSQVAVGHYAYALSLWRSFRLTRGEASLAEARAELEKAVSLDPALTAAHLQLGMVYDAENLRDRAMQEYRAAIRLNPDLAGAHYHLAQDEERSGAKQDAAAELKIYQRLRAKP